MPCLTRLIALVALAPFAHGLGLQRGSRVRRRGVVLRAGVESALMAGARPLAPLDVKAAAVAIAARGVARVDGVVDAAAAKSLRRTILDEVDGRTSAWAVEDDRYIAGTRLRFDEAVVIDLDGGARADVLLPREDDRVGSLVRSASRRLAPVLAAAAATLPDDGAGGGGGLELVECAALVSRAGADHQPLHADFLRFDDLDLEGLDDDELAALEAELDGLDGADDDFAAAAAREVEARSGGGPGDDDDGGGAADADMPPRCVVFVYLQDCPTAAHGPTAFLPGTATAEAHEINEFGDDGALQETYGPAELATCSAGDAVVYDASVLHFGSANAVDDRVVLYFSVARAGAAAAAHAAAPGDPPPPRMREVPRVPFASLLT